MERAKEFMRKLNIFLKGNNHIEREVEGTSSTIELVCFAEHMRQANNLMTEPFTPGEVMNIMIPIMGFTQEIVQGDTRNQICKELGEALDELIEDGVL